MYHPEFRVNRYGVPILNKQEIDTIGEKLIRDFCPKAMEVPMEIDIDGFVERYLGITQDFHYLSHCGVYLGMTVFNDTNKIPVYNPSKHCAEYVSAKARTVIIDSSLLEEGKEHRYRFTMGHEGGHDIFHSRYFGYDPNQFSFFDRGETPMIQCRTDIQRENLKPVAQWTDKDRMEWQANRLSSALLMPKSMVLKLIAGLPSMGKLGRDATYIIKVSKFPVRQQSTADMELSKPTADPITNKPVCSSETKTGRATDEYRNAFWNVMRSKAPKYDVQNALQVGTDTEGGYLVPDEFERTLVQALEDQNIFRQLAKIITTSTGDRKIPCGRNKRYRLLGG